MNNIFEFLEQTGIAYSESPSVQPELIVFVSFDLSGSTEYKQHNRITHLPYWDSDDKTVPPVHFEIGWARSVRNAFVALAVQLEASTPNFRFWKFQGDELLLSVPVTKVQEIVEILLAVDDVVRQTSSEIWQETKHNLDIKATMWCAAIDDKRNIRLRLDEVFESLFDPSPSNVPQNVVDYVGTSIDEGFRVAHAFARAKRVTVSYDIALLLLSEPPTFPDNDKGFHHVGFDELKGIWNQKPYPAIWFTTQYSQDKERTPYHTAITCTLSQNFLEEKTVHHLPLLELLKNIYANDAPVHEHHDIVRAILGLSPM